MKISYDAWTEQLYEYTENLYWTPQVINKKTPAGQGGSEKFVKTRETIRRQEVPLNILFNILMRLLPWRIKNRILSCFLSSEECDFGQQIEYISIYDQIKGLEFVQPDMVFEAEQARVCVELKIDAHLSIDQLYKYLFLLALWQYKTDNNKTPCLFFLTKRKLCSQWKPSEREEIFSYPDDLTSLHHFIRQENLPGEFGLGGSQEYLHDEVRKITASVKLGWATWQDVGNILKEEIDRLQRPELSEGEEILEKLIGDFLRELARRKLWKDVS